ncbi:hypothetical protein M878_42785 [Streptomyces roseochromogenus subsp. oscitans DS 12.976]|uniref:C4-dicarboxylate transporter DctA n=1 Tax=Streptomyces roseochromogenus subsp. oscitans DS 12.976 TaxID=1352936 RepID=V6JQ60_STRRC|nr:cation:dicarboxylase symporter family transporter [Streptomyces roseochromogenus]EST18994.1 hypothetical protein M878_42785 [Streptomyces roseochromogenus subsp. oscitans DS 12.976]
MSRNDAAPGTVTAPSCRIHRMLSHLYLQCLIAVLLGAAVGGLWPSADADLKPLGDGFIALVKMFIAPIIFCTVVHGIASMGNARAVGRVSLKALVYFEVLTTVAMVIDLAAAHAGGGVAAAAGGARKGTGPHAPPTGKPSPTSPRPPSHIKANQ